MFEDFLKDKHAENYIGTDDDMPDDFDSWLADLTSDRWFEYMEEFDALHPKK